MTSFAHLAAVAGLCRVYRDALTGTQRFIMTVVCVRANCQHFAAKFMTQHQRLLHHCVADARVLIGVQIRPANTNRLDLQQNLTGAGLLRFRYFIYTNILRAIKPCCKHFLSFRP